MTAAFNRNLLLHVNRPIASDFRLSDWRHLARYDVSASRIEMHLEGPAHLTVQWPGGDVALPPKRAHPYREFLRGEPRTLPPLPRSRAIPASGAGPTRGEDFAIFLAAA